MPDNILLRRGTTGERNGAAPVVDAGGQDLPARDGREVGRIDHFGVFQHSQQHGVLGAIPCTRREWLSCHLTTTFATSHLSHLEDAMGKACHGLAKRDIY